VSCVEKWIYFGVPGDPRPLAAIVSRAWVEAHGRGDSPSAVRYERVRRASGRATPVQIQARIDYYAGCCYMCGAAADTIDHVKPLAAGGSNWPSNLRPACRSCNSSKGARW